MQKIDVSDLYEAAYLTMCGCEAVNVRCIPVSKTFVCSFTFSGEGLDAALEAFRTKSAVVNLFEFRSAYNQISTLLHEAKKSFDREQKANKRQHGAGGEA